MLEHWNPTSEDEQINSSYYIIVGPSPPTASWLGMIFPTKLKHRERNPWQSFCFPQLSLKLFSL